MNFVFRLIFFTLLLSGCKNEPTLTFSSEIFTEEDLEICRNEPCSTVTIDYLRAAGDVAVSEKINRAIESQIIEALFLGENEQPSAKDIPQAAKDFILAYRDHQPDLPSEIDTGGYDAVISIDRSYQNDPLLSLEMIKYLFTGGAHGYGGTSFLNFDVETGEIIANTDLFINYDKFITFAEKKFRAVHKIPEGETINSTGFWFDEDTFYVPETIGFEENKLILIYNPYEIASYADGPILLEIPLDEVIPFLDPDLL